jgi:hypothetical protein
MKPVPPRIRMRLGAARERPRANAGARASPKEAAATPPPRRVERWRNSRREVVMEVSGRAERRRSVSSNECEAITALRRDAGRDP